MKLGRDEDETIDDWIRRMVEQRVESELEWRLRHHEERLEAFYKKFKAIEGDTVLRESHRKILGLTKGYQQFADKVTALEERVRELEGKQR